MPASTVAPSLQKEHGKRLVLLKKADKRSWRFFPMPTEAKEHLLQQPHTYTGNRKQHIQTRQTTCSNHYHYLCSLKHRSHPANPLPTERGGSTNGQFCPHAIYLDSGKKQFTHCTPSQNMCTNAWWEGYRSRYLISAPT